MAKKKRFNKKVIIILALVGVVLLGGGIGVAIYRQPKDPKVYASRAAEHMKKGNYASAAHNYAIAAYVAENDDPQKPQYMLSKAKVLLEWIQKDKTLADSTKSRNYGDALSTLRDAMRYKPDFIEAQRLLTKYEYAMYWNPRRPDYNGCVTTINKLLDLVPDDHEVLYKRAMAYAQLAKNDTAYLKPAMEDFRRLVEIAPCQEHYWLKLAAIHLAVQDGDHFERAEKIFKEALEANKDSAGLRINYAQFLLHRDRKPEALKWFNDAVKVRPNEASGYLALARYYQQERDSDRAVENLKKAIEVEQSNYRGYMALAQIYAFQKKRDESLTILKKGLDMVKKSKKPELKGAKLRNYRVGIIVLNHQLCDAMLHRSVTGAEKEQAVLATRNALKEMQKEIQDIDKGSFLFTQAEPYVTKIEGRLAMIDGNLVEAEKLLRRAYNSFRTFEGRPYLEPKTAELLINLYRQLGQHGESQKIIARFVGTSKDSPSALMAMLRLYIESRQYERARDMVRSMLEQNRSESLLSIQVALDVATGRSKRIPAELKELDPLAVQMFQHRAQQLWLEGEAESAIQLLLDVLARQPRHLAAMMKLIQWHRIRGESAQADEMLARARQAYKDDPKMLGKLSMLVETDRNKLLERLLAQASEESDPVRRALRLAGIYRSLGQEKKFLEYLDVAEAKDPQNPGVIRRRFDYTIGKSDWASAKKYADAAAKNNLDGVGGKMFAAQLAVAQGKLDEAIALTAEALRIRPRFSRAHSFMGNCYFAKGQIDQARKQYELAYSQNPSSISALVGLIRVSASVGNSADYTRWVELAYKFAPQNTHIREAYIRLRSDPKKVIKHREQIRKEQPGNLPNLAHLAMLYERTGRLAQAEQAYRAMVQISEGSPVAIRAMAYYLRRRNRDVEARSIFADYAARATDKVVAYLLWADYLDAVGDADQAETIYKKAVAVDPSDARGYRGVARFAARHGRWTQAADNQQKYIDIAGEKTPPLARKNLIIYLINAGELDDAEKKVEQRLQKDQTDAEMLTLKAFIYAKRKNYTKAREILDHTLKIRPDYVPALIRRSDVHLVNRDKASAISDLESARRVGTSPAVAVRLARLYESTGDVSNAMTILRGLLIEYPKDPVVLKAMVEFYGRHSRWSALETVLDDAKKAYPEDPFYLRKEAGMWLVRKVPAKAVVAIDAATKLAPDDVGMAFFRMRVLTEAKQYSETLSAGKKLLEHKDLALRVRAVMALAYAKSGDKSAAETEFSTAIKAAESGGQLLFVLQQIRLAYSPAQAVEKLKLWSSGRPDDEQIFQALGEMLVEQKDLKGAAEYLNKALACAKTDRRKAILMGRIGLIYFELGRHDAGLRMYEDALKKAPNDSGILNNLSWFLAHDMKKPDQALPYAQKACELAPNSAVYLDTYGYVLRLNGKYNEALNVLNRSVDKQAMPVNRLHLGEVHEKMNRPSAAMRQYKLGWELVKDDPDNKYYQELREAIKRLGGTPGGSTE